jgi:hypothetical protein
MNDIKDQYTESQRAFGSAFADFKSRTKRSDGLRRCEETATRGTGTGVCDSPLDEHGNCPNARGHLS